MTSRDPTWKFSAMRSGLTDLGITTKFLCMGKRSRTCAQRSRVCLCPQHAPRILLCLSSRNRPGISRTPHGDKTRHGHPRGGEGGTPALTPGPTLGPHMLTDQELLGPLGGRRRLPRAFLVQTRTVTSSSTAEPRGGPGRRGAGPVPPRPHSSRLTPPPVPCLLHTPGPQATLAGGRAWAGSPPRSSGQHHECRLRSPEARTCVPARCFSCTCQRWP